MSAAESAENRGSSASSIEFSFNGQALTGQAGDSIGAALLRHGVRHISASPRHGRPRGLLGNDWSGLNAFVTLDGPIGAPLDVAALLRPGMSLTSQRNAQRSGLLTRLTSRTTAPLPSRETQYDALGLHQHHTHCDVLIAGAGLAGLAAAHLLLKAGARVLIADRDWHPGGVWPAMMPANTSAQWLAFVSNTLDEIANSESAAFLPGAHVVFDPRREAYGLIVADRRDPYAFTQWHVEASQIILATGAQEAIPLCARNDLPGVMLSSSAAKISLDNGVAPGLKIVVTTNNDAGYGAACALADRGVAVTTLVDSRRVLDARLASLLMDRGIDLLGGYTPLSVGGREHVTSLTVGQVDGQHLLHNRQELPCDVVAVSSGWTPRLALTESGPADTPAPLILGAAAGHGALGPSLEQLTRDLRQLCRRLGLTLPDAQWPGGVDIGWTPEGAKAAADWFDHKQSADVVENLARDTTLDDILHDRQPAQAALFSPTQLLGHFKEPEAPARQLPTHNSLNAAALLVGRQSGWDVPLLFADQQDEELAVASEMRGARQAIALWDGSDGCRLHITGEDALAFMDRCVFDDVSGLTEGKAQQALTLNESGAAISPVSLSCISENHLIAYAPAAASPYLLDWLPALARSEWPELQVQISDLSEAQASLFVAGPRSRQLLLALKSSLDVSAEAMPEGSVSLGVLEGVAIMATRLSHMGEVCWRLDLPADRADALVAMMTARGRELGVTYLGRRAYQRLLVEKAFPRPGYEIRENSRPADILWPHADRLKDTAFIGRKALERGDHAATHLQLVGLRADIHASVMPVGATVYPFSDKRKETGDPLGHIINSFHSPALDMPVTLALVQNGHERIGEVVQVGKGSGAQQVRIGRPTVFDAHGRRTLG